jgi:hypothetical protein
MHGTTCGIGECCAASSRRDQCLGWVMFPCPRPSRPVGNGTPFPDRPGCRPRGKGSPNSAASSCSGGSRAAHWSSMISVGVRTERWYSPALTLHSRHRANPSMRASRFGCTIVNDALGSDDEPPYARQPARLREAEPWKDRVHQAMARGPRCLRSSLQD